MPLINDSPMTSLYDYIAFKWAKPNPPTPKECPYEK